MVPGDSSKGIAVFGAAGLSHGLAKERQSAGRVSCKFLAEVRAGDTQLEITDLPRTATPVR